MGTFYDVSEKNSQINVIRIKCRIFLEPLKKLNKIQFESHLKEGSGYFASRGKIAPCYFAIWRQNSPIGYFAASAKIGLILTQTEEKHYFASRGKIATFLKELNCSALSTPT